MKHQYRNLFNQRKITKPIVLDLKEKTPEEWYFDKLTRRMALLENRHKRYLIWRAKGSKANALKWELWRKEQYATFKKRRRVKRTKPRDNDRFTDHGEIRRQWRREHPNG